MTRARKVLLLSTLVAGLLVLAAATVWSQDVPPPRPEWVNEDGTINEAKLPKRMPVADQNGNIVGEVDMESLRGPADAPPDESAGDERPNVEGEVVEVQPRRPSQN